MRKEELKLKCDTELDSINEAVSCYLKNKIDNVEAKNKLRVSSYIYCRDNKYIHVDFTDRDTEITICYSKDNGISFDIDGDDGDYPIGSIETNARTMKTEKYLLFAKLFLDTKLNTFFGEIFHNADIYLQNREELSLIYKAEIEDERQTLYTQFAENNDAEFVLDRTYKKIYFIPKSCGVEYNDKNVELVDSRTGKTMWLTKYNFEDYCRSGKIKLVGKD